MPKLHELLAVGNNLDIDVASNKIGKRLLDYVFQPLL
jgi:hypothetical protein